MRYRITIVLFAALLLLTGCEPVSGPVSSAPAESSRPTVSVHHAQASNPAEPSSSKANEPQDTPPVFHTYRGITVSDEMLAIISEGEYVFTGFWDEPDSNMHLLEEWIYAFQNREEAKVVFAGYFGMGITGVMVLDADGSDEYRATIYSDPSYERSASEITGTMVVIRELDYVFPELPASFRTFLRKDGLRGLEIIDYDIETMPTLGVTTPEEAMQIAVRKHKMWVKYIRIHHRFWYGVRIGGIEPDDDEPDVTFVIEGALLYAGSPFYIFRHNPHVGTLYAVNADGGTLFLVKGEESWALVDDDNEIIITANPR